MTKLFICFLTALTFIPFTAFADSRATPSLKSHFYVGAHGTITYAKARYSNEFYLQGGGAANVGNTARTKRFFLLPGLSFGYTHPIAKHYLIGFDVTSDLYIGGKFLKKDISHPAGSNVTYKTKMRKRFSIQPSVTIGYAVRKDILAFVRFGISFARFNKELVEIGEDVTYKKNLWVKGFVPTLGVEWQLRKCWSALASLSYEMYRFNHRTVDIVTGALNPNNYYVSTKQRYWTLRIGGKFKI